MTPPKRDPRTNPARLTAHVPLSFDPAVTRKGREWADYARWLVGAIVLRRYLDGVGPAEFVPMASTYLNRHLPQAVWGPLLQDLQDAGVVECDGRYSFGRGKPGKCRCYRLGPSLRDAKVGPVLLSHPELVRKLNAAWEDERGALSDPVAVSLRGWHDQVEVLASAPYGEHILMDKLIEGDRRFHVCQQGRVHTNVANLPRQYRQFIRLAGRELASVDVSNSQPLLLALTLSQGEEQLRCGGRGLMNETREFCEHPLPIFIDSSDTDEIVFLRDCLSGTAYDGIVELTGFDRDRVKQGFLAVVYGKPRHMHTRVGRAVKELYPSVFQRVAALNRTLGHGGLPRRLQALESNVMIRRVAARLLWERPSMPLLTVHDSVLVPPPDADYARTVVVEEWRSEFGVTPGLKLSAFTAPQQARPKKQRSERQSRQPKTVTSAAPA